MEYDEMLGNDVTFDILLLMMGKLFILCWIVPCGDIFNAFLNSKIDVELYMKLNSGCYKLRESGMDCKSLCISGMRKWRRHWRTFSLLNWNLVNALPSSSMNGSKFSPQIISAIWWFMCWNQGYWMSKRKSASLCSSWRTWNNYVSTW